MSYLGFLRSNARFLAFGMALAFFSSFGQTFFISLFGEDIRETFGLAHSGFGACYSVATLCSGLTIIWLGRKLDLVDLRFFTAAIILGLAAACLSMWFSPGIVVLVVAIFMLRLFGQGLLSHTAMTSMARYYDEGRGTAISIAGLGFPLGEAILPLAAVMILERVGWRDTWLGIGVILAAVALPLALWLLRGHARRHDAHVRAVDGHDAVMPAKHQWTRGEVLRDARFYALLPAITSPGFIVTGLFFHQVHLVETRGWSMTWFAACFAAFAAAQLPASLVAGPLADRFGAKRLLPFCFLPMALGLAVLAAGTHAMIAPAFMILTGATCGMCSPVIGAMWAEIYGVKHLGGIRAMVTAIGVFATAGSPIAMGWLIDAGSTMSWISWASAAYAIAAVALAVLALRLTPGSTRPASAS